MINRSAFHALILIFSLVSSALADDHRTIIDAKTAKDMLDQGVLFVDVRSPIAFEHGHIPGAVNIDVRSSDFVAEFTRTVGKDQAFVVYCRGRYCDRSPEAILVLSPLGYEKIFYFRDGTPGWTAAGYALQTSAHEECPATGRSLTSSIEC